MGFCNVCGPSKGQIIIHQVLSPKTSPPFHILIWTTFTSYSLLRHHSELHQRVVQEQEHWCIMFTICAPVLLLLDGNGCLEDVMPDLHKCLCTTLSRERGKETGAAYQNVSLQGTQHHVQCGHMSEGLFLLSN